MTRGSCSGNPVSILQNKWGMEQEALTEPWLSRSDPVSFMRVELKDARTIVEPCLESRVSG